MSSYVLNWLSVLAIGGAMVGAVLAARGFAREERAAGEAGEVIRRKILSSLVVGVGLGVAIFAVSVAAFLLMARP